MKDDMKPETLMELSGYGSIPKSQPLFKYSVQLIGNDDVSFVSDKWSAVAKWLLEDDAVQALGMADYLEHLEGKFKSEDCDNHIYENIEELAAQAGYVITKGESNE